MKPISLLTSLLLTFPAFAQNSTAPKPTELGEVVVTGKAEDLLGIAPSASKGQASAEEIAARPFVRRGELLEVVPGVIITQHSGEGKANQYYLRGFNLDHGTDFGVYVDGIPVNMRTHAHGQGYADINFIIPEMVSGIDYWKGPYFAELGDLTTVGAARFKLVDSLPQGIASFTLGEHNFYRGLLADSISWDYDPPTHTSGKDGKQTATVVSGVPHQSLTYALEYGYNDGPFDLAQESKRYNGFLRYHYERGADTVNVTAMAYSGEWRSTDQVPQRAIDAGLIGRFGNIDSTDGGDSSRYSLAMDWNHQTADGGLLHADVYAGYYDLNLFSNFTYFLDDPVHGDQFQQNDGRYFLGGELRRDWNFDGGHKVSVGFQTKHDFIDGIGLYLTEARKLQSTVRMDDVYEGSYGLFASGEYKMNDWLRLQGGVRGDLFNFDVTSDRAANSGSRLAGIASPKVGVVFSPWDETEIYVNGGLGFHSNDARGVTLSADPKTGEHVDAAPPLVRTYGAEVGVRTEAVPHVVSTLALWYLHSDSELVYGGDTGTIDAGPASKRYGVEWSTYWRPNPWFTFDSELSYNHGRFETGDYIPNSLPWTWSGGVTVGKEEGFFGALRGRFFGSGPLIEDNLVKGQESFQVNARIGYRKKNWEIAVDCLNLFDRNDSDIQYLYASRLFGESVGVDDIHLHPVEPRTFRLTVTYKF